MLANDHHCAGQEHQPCGRVTSPKRSNPWLHSNRVNPRQHNLRTDVADAVIETFQDRVEVALLPFIFAATVAN